MEINRMGRQWHHSQKNHTQNQVIFWNSNGMVKHGRGTVRNRKIVMNQQLTTRLS